MTGAFLAAILWVLAVSAVGMMPRKWHPRLGLPMLALLPVVLAWLAIAVGPWWAVGLFVGALSIFRYPAKYFGLFLWRKLSGGRQLDPKEFP
jgi:hypothetical protein